MAAKEGGSEGEEFVYRISTAKEWEELQKNGSVFGGELDKSTGCFHLSKLDQVRPTLQKFFMNVKGDLYLLQIDAKKVFKKPVGVVEEKEEETCRIKKETPGVPSFGELGDGLIYELVDGNDRFPHFYGPSRSFCPLPLDVVTKAAKLSLSGSQYSCSLLN